MNFVPYASQSISDDDIQAVNETLTSDYLTQGPKIKEFEDRVAEYCGAKYAVAVNSGTSALHAACFAAGIKSDDEVITSPITFAASANCVLYCGGKPIFADVQKDTINIDSRKIAKRLSPKTKAIIPVHFAGHPCDLQEIQKIAKKNDLIVIEDAAHALGAEYKGSKVGACKYSDMTILSFHAVKHITTGEGGMILTNDSKLYERLLMFRTHGITRQKKLMQNKDEGPWYYEMQLLGFNYRMTDFQAALGLSQLAKLDDFVERRRQIISKYQDAFSLLKEVSVPAEKTGLKSSWHLFCIRVKDRKNIFQKLRENGLGVNVHYIPVYYQPYYEGLGYKRGICPNAEKYYDETITLPLYPKMKDQDVDFVISNVCKIIKESN